jgi:hypothetical protein
LCIVPLAVSYLCCCLLYRMWCIWEQSCEGR